MPDVYVSAMRFFNGVFFHVWRSMCANPAWIHIADTRVFWRVNVWFFIFLTVLQTSLETSLGVGVLNAVLWLLMVRLMKNWTLKRDLSLVLPACLFACLSGFALVGILLTSVEKTTQWLNNSYSNGNSSYLNSPSLDRPDNETTNASFSRADVARLPSTIAGLPREVSPPAFAFTPSASLSAKEVHAEPPRARHGFFSFFALALQILLFLSLARLFFVFFSLNRQVRKRGYKPPR